LAKSDDIDEVVRLTLDLSCWFKTKGLNQWRDPFPREVFEEEVSRGELFVLYDQGNVIASVALNSDAGEIWDHANEEALYLNRLAVSKSHSGKRIGEAMMVWAENEAKQRGVRLLRLVCDSKNPFLPDYYKRLGYESRGTKFYEPWKMTFARFEKPL